MINKKISQLPLYTNVVPGSSVIIANIEGVTYQSSISSLWSTFPFNVYLPLSGGTITRSLSVFDTIQSNRGIFSSLTANSAVFNIIDIRQYELSGFNVTGDVTVNGNISSTKIIYSSELNFGSLERPSLTGIKQALNSFLYVSPALSYVRINGSSSQTLEVGQALTTPTITWTSNKVEPQAVSQYLLTRANGIVSTGSFTFSSFNDPSTYNITTIGGTETQQTSSWSVRVTDWAGAQATGTASANWRYRVYFGVTSSVTPNSTDILNGVNGVEANRPLTTSRLGLGAKTVSPSNQYFYVAYPQRFGTTSTLKVNGLNSTSFTQQSIATFTNASGGTDSYYVYRSNNLLTATYTIEII